MKFCYVKNNFKTFSDKENVVNKFNYKIILFIFKYLAYLLLSLLYIHTIKFYEMMLFHFI